MKSKIKSTSSSIKRAHWTTTALQTVSFVLIIALAILFSQTTERYTQLQNSVTENAIFAVMQIDRETRKLYDSLQETAKASIISQKHKNDAAIKYDILYSRLDLLKNGSFSAGMMEDTNAKRSVEHIENVVKRIEPFFNNITQHGELSTDGLVTVMSEVDAILIDCEQLIRSVITKSAERRSHAREEVMSLQIVSATTTAVLLFCGIGLLFGQRRQISQIKDANSDLEDLANTLQDEVDQAVKSIRDREEEIIERLSLAAGHKDSETELHTRRVAAYSEAIALALGLEAEESHDIRVASLMHDIGKVSIPDGILQKAGPLSTEEFNLMKTHTIVGSDILAGSTAPLLQLAADIARGHHERWDGGGYPYGLKASDIPLASRLVALADNFDALTTARPYKQAWSTEAAVAHIRNNAGKQFDPACVKAFEKALPTIIRIKAELMEPIPDIDTH